MKISTSRFFSIITPTATAIALIAGQAILPNLSTTAAANKLNAATSPANWSFVTVQPSTSPRAFGGSDGKTNLVYELLLTNFNFQPADLTALQISDTKGNILLSLSKKELQAVLTQVGSKSNQTILPPGKTAIVWVNIVLDANSEKPSVIRHSLSYKTQPPNKKVPENRTTQTDLTVENKPPVVISPPLEGRGWLAIGGYSGQVGHRRCLFPIDNRLRNAQRFAIDWIKLDDKNRTCHGKTSLVESYTAYAQPVFAVSDGTVFGVVDKFPNQVPPKPSGDMEYAGGNSITLKLADDTYAFYAHLKPGSILVKEGDQVKQGQIIAQVGNVGNSTAPHLHFHVTDEPYVLGANSLPYVFNNFTLEGEITDLNKLFINDCKGAENTISKPTYAGLRSNELPKEGSVVTFAERPSQTN